MAFGSPLGKEVVYRGPQLGPREHAARIQLLDLIQLCGHREDARPLATSARELVRALELGWTSDLGSGRIDQAQRYFAAAPESLPLTHDLRHRHHDAGCALFGFRYPSLSLRCDPLPANWEQESRAVLSGALTALAQHGLDSFLEAAGPALEEASYARGVDSDWARGLLRSQCVGREESPLTPLAIASSIEKLYDGRRVHFLAGAGEPSLKLPRAEGAAPLEISLGWIGGLPAICSVILGP